MKCFKCGNELVYNNNNPHYFTCPLCNNYSITESAINIIPASSNNNWENVLQNYVSDNSRNKKIVINSDIIHKLFGS